MRSLDPNVRISAQSIPEIDDALTRAITELPRDLKFRDRKIAVGPMMNAVIVHFLAKSPEERELIVREGIRGLEEMLSQPEGQAQTKQTSSPAPRTKEPSRPPGNPALARFKARNIDMTTGEPIDPHKVGEPKRVKKAR